MTDKISLSLQIAEAEQHVAELRGPASKRGVGQSGAQLRLEAAMAILNTLAWLRDIEPEVREFAASKRSASHPSKEEIAA